MTFDTFSDIIFSVTKKGSFFCRSFITAVFSTRLSEKDPKTYPAFAFHLHIFRQRSPPGFLPSHSFLHGFINKIPALVIPAP